MVSRILIDTDVLIDAGRGIETAIKELETAAQTSTLAISAITNMELIIGCRNGAEFKKLEKFIQRFEVVYLNEVISKRAIDGCISYLQKYFF